MKQELQYQQFGSADAPCIVFLHGEGLSAQMWQPQIESLKDYHCIAPTFSVDCMEDPPTKFCFESAADSVADLISSVSFEGQAHLVGFSFGAALIMELLARYPERCISATLISPPSKSLSSASSMLLDAYENRALPTERTMRQSSDGRNEVISIFLLRIPLPNPYRDFANDSPPCCMR
ncbi:MAG: alpha/beta fold hydrolase [Anaerofustis sp.]